jgi:hypothetical protein
MTYAWPLRGRQQYVVAVHIPSQGRARRTKKSCASHSLQPAIKDDVNSKPQYSLLQYTPELHLLGPNPSCMPSGRTQ